MHKRCEPRFGTNEEITITSLGECRVRQAGTVRNFAGSGLGLEVQIAIPTGTAVRIEREDAILLGEVMYQRPTKNSYFVGIQLEHALCGLRELDKQASRFRKHDVSVASH